MQLKQQKPLPISELALLGERFLSIVESLLVLTGCDSTVIQAKQGQVPAPAPAAPAPSQSVPTQQ